MYVWIIAAVLLAAFIYFGYVRKPRIPDRLCLRTTNSKTGIEQLYRIRKDRKSVLLPFVCETGSFRVLSGRMNFRITIRACDTKCHFMVTGTPGFYDLMIRQTVVFQNLPNGAAGLTHPQIISLFRNMVFSYAGFHFRVYLPDQMNWGGQLNNLITADLIRGDNVKKRT